MERTDSLNDAISQAKALGREAIMILEDENSEGLIKIMKEMIEREF